MAGTLGADWSDADLRRLLAEDADAAWRAFIDRHTPTILAVLERAGLRDRDEAMAVYTLVCERLAGEDCARLRRWNPAKGSLGGWLAVVARRVMVDWVRSRAGRPRVFGAVARLGALERRVFELFYWEERSASEISELLTVERSAPVSLLDTLEALDAVNEALEARHYAELMSMAARARTPVSLDAEIEAGGLDPPDMRMTIESAIERGERDRALEGALAALAPEEAAIVRLHYVEGLSLAEVRRALNLTELGRPRVSAIVRRLRDQLEPRAGGGLAT